MAVVQNGIIENYRTLRAELQAEGVVFRSDTDTEVIPHLLSRGLLTVLASGPANARNESLLKNPVRDRMASVKS